MKKVKIFSVLRDVFVPLPVPVHAKVGDELIVQCIFERDVIEWAKDAISLLRETSCVIKSPMLIIHKNQRQSKPCSSENVTFVNKINNKSMAGRKKVKTK